ncbi:MFS transporter [Sphingomonas montanisoli]|uniref:MFS transporter n=1 Tax=Sphingomonas montanisoli TaxID=2606412 RepID=A0A5D9C342_9SPHN|nr:MFS transporter [Sphingomonas montanisoli]TZG26089.1 MFS transporter [Sphingomonas montanisoli]
MADAGIETIGNSGPGGPFAPLRWPLFRRIWSASLFSNFGQLIQGVGAAWAMTQMTGRAEMVGLVQSATFAPIMLLAVIAGAVADVYDRRKIALYALSLSLVGAVGLSLVSAAGLLTPGLLLVFCFIVGTGAAMFAPAWQASVGEQVPQRDLPAAIGLNSISYNIARSFGPAIGGFLVALAGVLAAFGANALSYIPLIIVMYLWKRMPEKSRLPPEGLVRAVISGVRYVFHSPHMRRVCIRTIILATAGTSASALMPLIARQLLGGDATTYGIMLGCFGMGAVAGALSMAKVRARMSNQRLMVACALVMALCYVGVGFSRWAVLSGLLLAIAGSGWMVSIALCNISIQVAAPRWVTGRALASFQTATTGGIVIGSWGWGRVAESHGTDIALMVSGAALVATLVVGLWIRMPEVDEADERLVHQPIDVDRKLDLKGRSGPIVVTIEYRVAMDDARAFYGAMQKVEKIRARTGAYGWSIARDIGDPEIWTERYHTPTWHDYLRQRSRLTETEHEMTQRATAFHQGEEKPRVRRKLERPFGSVRWSDEAPDRGDPDIIMPVSPSQASG